MGVMRRFAFVAAALVAALCLVPSTAGAITAEAPDFETTGPVETVYSWSANRCDHTHIGDLPQRAFRDYNARQQLILAHSSFKDNSGGSRRLTGSYIGSSIGQGLTVDCTPVFKADLKDSPSSYNNYEWLAAPYTTDGQRVYSITYDEFYPWETYDTADCRLPDGSADFDCLYTGLKLATSTNGGNSYSELLQPNHTVATLPYQYESQDLSEPDGHDGFRFGYYDPSNVFKGPDGAYYVMFPTAKFRAQSSGTCIMRTTDLSTPGSWRMYRDPDGPGGQAGNFLTPFVRPYPAEPPNPQDFTCTPLDNIQQMHGSVTYNRYLKSYMLVGEAFGGGTPDIYYSVSKDLINWEPPKKLVTAQIIWETGCTSTTEQPVLYASIVDNDSTTRNFETTDRDFHLYLTRYNAGPNGFSCQAGAWRPNNTSQDQSQRPPGTFAGEDRDVIRVPIRLNRKAGDDRLATLESSGITGAPDGFDWSANGSGTIFRAGPGGAYEGNYSAHLLSPGTTNGPYAGFTVNWPNGTDIWYGSAFKLDPGFISRSNRVMIMRWLNSHLPNTASRWGGIELGTDDQFHLIRESTSARQELGSSFTLPEGSWFWIEVHQWLESDGVNKKPISEVFVDGGLVASSSAVNAFPDGEGVPNRLYFGYPLRTSASNYTEMSLDRASISPIQRGPVGAPATPPGINGFEGNGYIGLFWRPSDVPGGGYRLYEQQLDGTWAKVYETSSGAYLTTGQVNCVKHRYRVSAFKSTGEESPLSEEIELMPRDPNGPPCPGS
jgi:hypothetical protein